MSEAIAIVEPEAVWRHFAAISGIPRCSKKEERVRSYVLDQAQRLGLDSQTDEIGNVVIRRPGAGASADHPGVVLQGHLDMVCEKNADTEHNFDTDPIRLRRDGDWLTAENTTLGADNGIAVAMMLAMLEIDAELPPLECLFTVDEESGLTGALKLDPSLVRGRRLINLDSEEEGFFCIGCAGGKNTYGELPIVRERVPSRLPDPKGVRLAVTGLRGGHSGINIHEGRGNAVVLGARVLDRVLREVPSAMLADIDGGDKHNAIPREIRIDLVVPGAQSARLGEQVRVLLKEFRDEFGDREPGLDLRALELPSPPEQVVVSNLTRRIADLLLSLPHGVLGMSHEVENLVETSTNLAAVHMEENALKVMTSQRSSRGTLIEWASDRIAACIRVAGGTARADAAYPAWPPQPDSRLLKTAVGVYREVAGAEPEVGAFHAGLECGVIGDKVGDMEMISFGPDMDGVHTPDERLNIGSTQRTWTLLLEVLRAL